MDYKELRFKISAELFKKFKLICVEKDLSLPKQTSELLRKFVEIDEQNKKLIKK